MRLVPALLAGLLLSGTLAAAPAKGPTNLRTDPLLQDIERYLLLYAATGDERFLTRLNSLGAVFEKKLDGQKQAATLKDIWQLHQQTLEKVHDAYTKRGVDLRQALQQTRQVAELFDSFLQPAPGATQGPTLLDEVRELALLEARGANRKLLGELTAADGRRIAELQEEVQARLEALPDSPERDKLQLHWRYLRKAQTADGTLLYPFNAQIEYLTAHLPQG